MERFREFLGEKSVSIDIDWAGDKGVEKDFSKKYGIKIKVSKDTAMVSGDPKKIKKFLLGPDYEMDKEDVEDLFPELG